MCEKTSNKGTTLLTYDLSADGLTCVRCGSSRFGDEGEGGFCLGCGSWVVLRDQEDEELHLGVDLGGGDA